MSDLIDRESAIVRACAVIKDDYVAYDVVQALKAMPSAQPQTCDDAISREDAKWVVFCNRDHVEDQANAIDSLPCVQPQRMKGRWIEDGYNHYKAVCSECGEPCATYIMGKPRDKFCKWCGAEMRGEQDE